VSEPDYQLEERTLSTTNDPNLVGITVGDIPPWPNYKLTTTPMPTYLAFGCITSIREPLGYGSAPKAGAKLAFPAAVWRMHTGEALKVILWVAMTVDDNPQFPHWDVGNYNEILVYRQRDIITPCNAPDGQRCTGMWGQYVYRFRQPPSDADSLLAGKSPFDIDAPQVIMPSQFSQYIFSPSPATTGAPGSPLGF